MSRPKKWRRVCRLPKTNTFGPLNGFFENSFVVMSVDEYETIRLIDFEGMKQEECAVSMNVARTTVQAIYEKARRKIADSLVNGKKLIIEGGEYKLCENIETHQFRGKGCGKGRRRQQ